MLAFPCNQFGDQESGTNAEILAFATGKYDATFPMFAKIEVNGGGACELYKWLRHEQPGAGDTDAITWNFEKFLVDRAGKVVARYGPQTSPEDIATDLPQYL